MLFIFSDTVRRFFPNDDSTRIKGYIRQKLNNADKTMKRKLKGDPLGNDIGLSVSNENSDN